MGINNRQGFTYKSWLLLAPLSCATLVAISRTMDYRHHATDVIAGAVIGLLGGWYAYRQYYPVRCFPLSPSLPPPLAPEEIAHLPLFSILSAHAHGIAYLRPLGIQTLLPPDPQIRPAPYPTPFSFPFKP